MLPAAIVSQNALGTDLHDLRLAVGRVGDDPGLRPGERHRGLAAVEDRDAEQRRRDALTGGEQHVHLALRRVGGHVVGQALEVVGGLAHRRHDDDDVVAVTACPHDVVGDGTDTVGIGHRSSTELLYEQGHDGQL